MTWIFLGWGCSVYEPNLLGEQVASDSGGTTVGAAGEAGSGGRSGGSAGSAGTKANGGNGSSGAGSGGAVGVAGTNPVGGAGETSPSAGADNAGDAGATVCKSETPAEFCARVGKDCGAVDGTDNCGNAVVGASCGSCNGFKACGGGGRTNVCGALTEPAMGGTATASSVGSIGENGSKAFDLNVNSKWFAGDNAATGWLAYQFSGTTSHVVHAYSVTSANDVPQRDPSAWQLQGSSNGASWVIVDQRSAQVFASRHQTNSYTCSNQTAYRWYRLLITANGGATSLQLAELVLYGD